MAIEFQQLDGQPRLLMEAELEPIQGTRFQPTGFPDLGAAEYSAPDANGNPTQMILVESAQSVANRLEDVCWDEAADSPHPALAGMPYVSVSLEGDRQAVSIREAHRLNTPYFTMGLDEHGVTLHNRILEHTGYDTGTEVDVSRFAKTVLIYDPNALLHGVFFSNIRDGRLRMKRSISGFIEACNVNPAASGFVKNATFDPSGNLERTWIDSLDNKEIQELGYTPSNYKNRMKETVQNIIGSKTEYVAQKITAYFNLDLAQIRAYGLGESAERFLITLALWKVRKFLDTGLRLRTACDLGVVGDLNVTRPEEFDVPSASELESDLPGLIEACASDGLFADPPVTELTFQRT
ncbi:MAG: type I-U CRISPR-associated RAMP protein Csb1/Cas7u [Dehalococcoidia bacterium]|nr:type I-U CRISPR-associated RAMP protein Csb1/Cas7u [Dehalococcoidia bacterium]